MSAALFGILGVVVGGLVSTAVALFSAVRQELNDAVVAARLIDLDLRDERDDDQRSTDLWIANRAALARALGHQEWLAVSAAFQPSDLSASKRMEVKRTALSMLEPIVSGKRSAVTRRFGNALPSYRRRAS